MNMKKTGLKTITFAMVHFSVAFSVAWALTGSMVIGGMIALVEPAINTVAYAFHEQIWQRFENKDQSADKQAVPMNAMTA